MTQKTDTAEGLLRTTLMMMVAEPVKLSIATKKHPGAAYFTISPPPNDYGKVVGKAGSHVQALEFLLYRLGKAQGELYGVRVRELDQDAQRQLTPRKKIQDYDEAPAMDLLGEWLVGFGVPARIFSHYSTSHANTWKFVIRTDEEIGRTDLIAIDAHDPKGRTIIGQLGTLFRAIGNNGGVSLILEVAE